MAEQRPTFLSSLGRASLVMLGVLELIAIGIVAPKVLAGFLFAVAFIGFTFVVAGVIHVFRTGDDD